MNILKKIPFSYLWILRRAVGDDVKNVLDLGCGDGALMKALSNGETWEITGFELYEEAVDSARKSGIYKKVFRTDVSLLPEKIKNAHYDIVFSSQVLEHLPKDKALNALKQWEKLAKKRVVISTTNGFIEYEPLGKKEENNPYQKHLSGWSIDEFRSLGFKVSGQGAGFVYGGSGLARKINLPPIFWEISAFLFAPFVYFFPTLATYLVAWKEK